MSLNSMKRDCGSIFVCYLHYVCFRNGIRHFLAIKRFNNNIIHKHDKGNVLNWGTLHMFSRQIGICLTHSVYKLCTNCEECGLFAKTKPLTIITTVLHLSKEIRIATVNTTVC